MKRVFIINGHQPSPISEGRLNASLVDRYQNFFEGRGAEVKLTKTAEPYDVEEEVANHQWADLLILQHPVNWMGVPWGLKKYQDEVYSAGLDGRLCNSDGRDVSAPKENYGLGGVLTNTRYMISLTFNAPKEAFNDPKQDFFAGGSVDDLVWQTHLNMKFFGMKPLPTYAAYDVFKNPEIEKDFRRLEEHLVEVFEELSMVKA